MGGGAVECLGALLTALSEHQQWRWLLHCKCLLVGYLPAPLRTVLHVPLRFLLCSLCVKQVVKLVRPGPLYRSEAECAGLASPSGTSGGDGCAASDTETHYVDRAPGERLAVSVRPPRPTKLAESFSAVPVLPRAEAAARIIRAISPTPLPWCAPLVRGVCVFAGLLCQLLHRQRGVRACRLHYDDLPSPLPSLTLFAHMYACTEPFHVSCPGLPSSQVLPSGPLVTITQSQPFHTHPLPM